MQNVIQDGKQDAAYKFMPVPFMTQFMSVSG